jgi:hypothetical protein
VLLGHVIDRRSVRLQRDSLQLALLPMAEPARCPKLAKGDMQAAEQRAVFDSGLAAGPAASQRPCNCRAIEPSARGCAIALETSRRGDPVVTRVKCFELIKSHTLDFIGGAEGMNVRSGKNPQIAHFLDVVRGMYARFVYQPQVTCSRCRSGRRAGTG